VGASSSKDVTFSAGLSVGMRRRRAHLVACKVRTRPSAEQCRGKIVHRFNLPRTSAFLDAGVYRCDDPRWIRGDLFVWHASALRNLLVKGTVRQLISLRKPAARLRVDASHGVTAEP